MMPACKTWLLGFVIYVACSVTTHASLEQIFRTDEGNGAIIGDTYTLTHSGLIADGVTFDATLTVKGSGDLTQNTAGLGVSEGGSELVSRGQLLTFSMSVSGEIGGSVSFDGFTELDYNSFGDTDSGVLSLDMSAATLTDNFFTTTVGVAGAGIVDISPTLPTVFSAIAASDDLNSFRVDDVTGRFTGTPGSPAVPEPISFIVWSGIAVCCVSRHRRRAN